HLLQTASGELSRYVHPWVCLGSAFDHAWLCTIGPVSYMMICDRHQQSFPQRAGSFRLSSVQLGPKCFQSLPRSLEAQLSRHHIVALCGLGRHCTDQIVYQEVRPNLLANHIRSLAPQHIHSQRLLDGSYVELCMPPGTVKPLKLSARVHVRVEQARNN